MNKKTIYIKVLLVILLIILIVLIIEIANIHKKVENSNKINKNTINNTDDNRVALNEQFNQEFDIFNDAEQQAEIPYRDEYLNNFEFEIKNIPDEILEKIPDKDKFDKEIKKFVYLEGLVRATEANYYDYALAEDIQSNKIAIRFSLNNVEKNLLLVVMNMKTGELDISNMKFDF